MPRMGPARTVGTLVVRILWRLLGIALAAALVLGFWLGWPSWVEFVLAGLLLAAVIARALGYVRG
ncbi:MAG TPA: hypothetical protein VEP50_00050 [bacterium]|nr:hypothetical protein [bacterium]